MDVLGTQVFPIKKNEINHKIEKLLTNDKDCTIATLNPEILLEANDDAIFRNILNTQSIQTIDGFGLLCALKYKYKVQGLHHVSRLTGIDLMLELLREIEHNKSTDNTVFLLAPKDGLSTWKQTASSIETSFPRIHCVGRDLAFQRTKQPKGVFDPEMIREIAAEVQRSQSRYVFCSFGAPYQEYFLDKLKNARLGKACVYMGVGGSFDFITGNQMRAPRWMQKMGLEWIFRLIIQPNRLRRIMRAVIIFPFKVLIDK